MENEGGHFSMPVKGRDTEECVRVAGNACSASIKYTLFSVLLAGCK